MQKIVITSLVLLICIAGVSAVAQNPRAGTWTASISSKDDSKIQLNLERRNDKGKNHQSGQSYELSDLQGLSREQVMNGGAVSFSVVREAGRLDCEGTFQNGKGSGTFRFTPNAAFISGMKSRGFDFESAVDDFEDRIFAATTLNVTTALVDDLVSAGFDKIGIDDLFKAAIFKIDARFVREVAQMGFNDEPFESLVKMQIFKVTPEFIAELRTEGLTDLKVEDIVKLRIFKIDANYIRQAKAEGGPTDVESLVQRKIGVARRVR